MVSAPLIEPEPPAAAQIEATTAQGPEATTTAPTEILPARRQDDAAQPRPEPKLEPVIPLVHAPDDPGPEADEESDTPVDGENSGWRKIFE
jgi:hypothetical protein